MESFETSVSAVGARTPQPLLKGSPPIAHDISEATRELERVATHRSSTPHMGSVMESFARTSKIII